MVCTDILSFLSFFKECCPVSWRHKDSEGAAPTESVVPLSLQRSIIKLLSQDATCSYCFGQGTWDFMSKLRSWVPPFPICNILTFRERWHVKMLVVCDSGSSQNRVSTGSIKTCGIWSRMHLCTCDIWHFYSLSLVSNTLLIGRLVIVQHVHFGDSVFFIMKTIKMLEELLRLLNVQGFCFR